MNDFTTTWTRIKRSFVAFAEAVEGTSAYQFERIDQLQRELAEVKAGRHPACETHRKVSET